MEHKGTLSAKIFSLHSHMCYSEMVRLGQEATVMFGTYHYVPTTLQSIISTEEGNGIFMPYEWDILIRF